MTTIVLLARLLLVLVFGVAGAGKLFDRAGSRWMLTEFGLPEALAGPGAVLLPVAELAVAVALLFAGSAWWGALGAVVLLALFIAGIGLNLARGRRPDCHCFGQIASGKIGASTLVRNGLLAVVALFVLVAGRATPGPSTVAWIGDLTGAERAWLALGVVALAVMAIEGWALLQLVGQNGRLLLRMEALQVQVSGGDAVATGPANGLPVGAPAPEFALAGLHGETQTLESLRAQKKPALLIFTDPNCGPCSALLPDLARWQRELVKTLNLTPISRGTVEENQAKVAPHRLGQVLLQQDREVMEAYQVMGTPGAVLVNADGNIGSPAALGEEAIRALVARLATGKTPAPLPLAPYPPAGQAGGPCPHCGQYHDQQAAAAPPMQQGLAVGTAVPALKLPDLEGREIDLEDFRGRETLLLFWSPFCGYCSQMLPALKEWEQKRPEKAPALVIVSTGTPEANAAQGLASPVVLEDGFATGQAFGVGGTPSAVLIDASGKVAAPAGVGAAAVLALAQGSGR